jgi:hypothetical protein
LDSGGGANSSDKKPFKWFIEELSKGAMESSVLFQRAEKQGIKKDTLYRAKGELGIKAAKEGFRGGWVWKLNNQEEQQEDKKEEYYIEDDRPF